MNDNAPDTPTTDEERPLIVAVDDEPDILRVLELALGDEGFEVLPVQRSTQAAQTVRERRPALVLLDLMMPEMDGYEVMEQVRAFSAVPIIVLTARGSNRDVVSGLERGADDYLSKPFNLGELAARVRAVLRRSKPEAPAALGVSEFDGLRVDFVRRAVSFNGQDIHLTRNEWRLLEQFARNPGRVISHEELLTRAWGPEYRHDRSYLRVGIRRLRDKLEDDSNAPRYIRTIPGRGYLFEAP